MPVQTRQHAWTLVVFSLILASFVGGAIRVLMAPDQVRGWLETIASKNQLKFEFEFDNARLALADGSIPLFGVELEGLRVRAKDPCITRSQLHVSRVYVPLSLTKFLGGLVKFKTLQVDDIRLDLIDAVCASSGPRDEYNTPSGVEKSASPQVVAVMSPEEKQHEFMQSTQSFFRHRFAKEMVNSRRWLDGIQVKNLQINRQIDGSLTPVGMLSNFVAEVPQDGSPFELSFRWVFAPESFWNLKAAKFLTKFSFWPDKAEVSIDGRYKEGRMNSTLKLDIPAWTYLVELKNSNIPVGALSHVFARTGLISVDFDPQHFWFNCGVVAKGEVKAWRTNPIHVRGCEVTGALGRLRAEEFQLKLSPTEFLTDLFIDFEALELNKVVEATEIKAPRSVFSDLGRLNGRLNLKSFDDYKFVGALRDVAIQASRGGRKRDQLAQTVSFELSFKDDRLSGLVNDVDLVEGSWQGEISFNLSRDLKSGLFQYNIKELGLNKEVQRVIYGGELAALEVYGQAKLDAGEITEWRGDAGAELAKGVDWRAKKLTFSGGGKNGKTTGQLKVAELELYPGNGNQKWLRPLFLDYEKLGETIKFESLVFNFENNGENGKWYRSQTRSQEIIFASYGKWRGSKLNGVVTVDFPALKLLEWDLAGEFSLPQVQPSAKMLKELAKKDPSLVDKASASGNRLDFLRDLLAQDKFSKIKKLGQEVIDKAKNMLPQDAKPSPKDETKEAQ